MITEQIEPNDGVAAAVEPLVGTRPRRLAALATLGGIAAAVLAALVIDVASVEAAGDLLSSEVVVETASVEPESETVAAPAVAAPAPPTTTPDVSRIDLDPIAQMPTRPVARPRPAPAKPRPRPVPQIQQQVANAPTPHQLADLYTKVGRELQAMTKVDRNTTIDLWPRYRWVNFMDAIKTPAKRAAAAEVLEKILAEAGKKQQP